MTAEADAVEADVQPFSGGANFVQLLLDRGLAGSDNGIDGDVCEAFKLFVKSRLELGEVLVKPNRLECGGDNLLHDVSLTTQTRAEKDARKGSARVTSAGGEWVRDA